MRYSILKNIFLVCLLVLFLSRYIYAAVISPESIIPKPQNIQMLSSEQITLDSSWKIMVNSGNEGDMFTADYLQKKILEASARNINPEIVDISQISTDKRIIIGDPAVNPVIAAIATAESSDINIELIKDEFNEEQLHRL